MKGDDSGFECDLGTESITPTVRLGTVKDDQFGHVKIERAGITSRIIGV